MIKSTDGIIAYSLADIALWSDRNTAEVHIPALQRGLVWKPKQIELLWDSLFRGIPIGSFVICPYIATQTRSGEATAKYHLLDGQQRANAIQLGFDDFASPQNPKGALLWLDLQPEKIPQHSTRNFLFRIATPAHPWGYDRSDNEGYLRASDIRNGLKIHYDIEIKAKESDENDVKSPYVRPTPQKIHPFDAEYPVPVSLLFKVFLANNKTLPLAKLSEDLHAYADLPWARNVLKAIQNGTINSLGKIEKGLNVATETSILALCAPDELMSISEQEKNNEEKEDITNIEHLFQRLNRQGTPLNGEELIYSMIKAYWPEIVQGIDGLERKLMPASKLVALAFRVVLTEENWDKTRKIAPDQTVSGIRKLATNFAQQPLREKIIRFINGSDEFSLRSCCNRIDDYMGINNNQYTWGLPPFLRSSLVYESPDFYLLLLLLARRHLHISEETSRLLTGCITWCSWFGSKTKKITDHVAALYSCLKDDLSADGIYKTIALSHNFFNPILTKEEISRFIVLPDMQNVQDWTWWNLIQHTDEKIQAQHQVIWDSCVSVLRDRRSLLLYAQRVFMNERFSDYDPARKDLWEEHNRPWDYDHILPYYYTYNQKSNNNFMTFCKQWANNNGNFRAWPFEDNRSDQATLAGDKLNEATMKASFITKEELPGYNQGRQVIENAEAALKFAEACRSRMLRIYNEWFDSLWIGHLLEKYREGETNGYDAV